MPLALHEIQVGAIAYFDISLLSNDPSIKKPAFPPNRPSPFICFQAQNGQSAWAVVTTQYRRERLVLEKAWRVEGSVQWRTDDLYLNDGACTYVGPDQSFVNAGVHETPFTTINRPQLIALGVAAVLAEVINRNGPHI
jgi:hypothetical protein